MPRLLTPEEAEDEALAIAEEDVRRFRSRHPSAFDPDYFFEKIARHCGVLNDLTFQAMLARACYPTDAFGLTPVDLLPDERKRAQDIVRHIRREIKALNSRRQEYAALDTNRKRNPEEAIRGLNREARAHQQHLLELYDDLMRLSGSTPGTNVYAVWDRVDEVRLRLATDVSGSRFVEAVREIDLLLTDWKTATQSKQGRGADTRELDLLIRRLASCYRNTTGREPNSGKHFCGFVELVVDRLPYVNISGINTAEQARIKKRVQTVLAAG
jgi:hypothetical protein